MSSLWRLVRVSVGRKIREVSVKIKIKKCPQCGLEITLLAGKKIVDVGKTKIIVDTGKTKRKLTPTEFIRLLGAGGGNEVFFPDREEYEEIKKCPRCDVILKEK